MISLKEIEKGKHKYNREAVFGIYQNHLSVDNGVNQLKTNGFRNEDVSVLMPTEPGTQTLAHQKSTKAPEGTTTGIASSAVMGGGLGWLVGISALAVPGIGPFIAAGPIMAALAGATVGGAVGGVAGALIGMGIPEYKAKRYESFVKDGGILLSVHVDDSEWSKKAQDILTKTGAQDIASNAEVKSPHEEIKTDFNPKIASATSERSSWRKTF
jgi:hypothetical protein